jgi:hypothetical protein
MKLAIHKHALVRATHTRLLLKFPLPLLGSTDLGRGNITCELGIMVIASASAFFM